MCVKKRIVDRVSEIDWGVRPDSDYDAPLFVSKGDVYDIISEEFNRNNVIPYYMVEYIQRCKFEGKTLLKVMSKAFEGTWSINGMNDYQEWIIENEDSFCLAWINGYKIEGA